MQPSFDPPELGSANLANMLNLIYGNQIHTPAATGVSAPPTTMTTTSLAADIHPHDQPRSLPLEAIEGFSLTGALVIYAALNLIRQSHGHGPSGPAIPLAPQARSP